MGMGCGVAMLGDEVLEVATSAVFEDSFAWPLLFSGAPATNERGVGEKVFVAETNDALAEPAALSSRLARFNNARKLSAG